jgi:hypothetical protein
MTEHTPKGWRDVTDLRSYLVLLAALLISGAVVVGPFVIAGFIR